jgi:hypothetical protein
MESEPSRRLVPVALTILLAMTVAGRALAAPVPPGFGAAAPPSPAVALAEADAALDAGELERAAALYEALVRSAAGSSEAAQAQRALKILSVTRARSASMAPRAGSDLREGGSAPPAPPSVAPLGSPGTQALPAPGAPPLSGKDGMPGDDRSKQDVVNREVPYSTRTKERLRLTVWEKVDFGVTSFLYGLSVGFSFGLSNNDHQDDDLATPAALGASLYTAAAIAYLSAADPDRGDLPLALAIGSYLPTSTLLFSNILYDNPNDKKVALAVATTGLLAIPIAVLATRTLDLDPGDTQLVRDAGFWGLLLASTATLAWGGREVDNGFGNTYRQDPSSRRLSVAGALGLYGGLGLGALAAANSEISLERVRVSTWGGYGGGLLGLLIGSGSGGKSENAWAGVTVGALLGLVVTFAATGSLDGIPPETTTVAAARARRRLGSAAIAPRLSPSIVPVSVAGGTGAIPTLGFSGTL